MPAVHRRLVIVLLACSCLGCGDSRKDAPIPLVDIPPAVLKAAKDKLPDVAFDTAYRGTLDGKQVYEIRGKTKAGKTREVEVNDQGVVVNVE